MVGVPFRSHVRMAERSKASNPRLVVESRGVRLAWVRIPLLPEFFKCLELGVDL